MAVLSGLRLDAGRYLAARNGRERLDLRGAGAMTRELRRTATHRWVSIGAGRTERKPVWRPSFLSILLSVSVFAMLIALATALLP